MRVKKIFLILLTSLCLFGCTKITDMSFTDITDIFTHQAKRANRTRTGFKYYLPSGMTVKNYGTYNEILKANRNYYYLYVDMISYVNKVENKYDEKNDAYYSSEIKNGDKFGYLEINLIEKNQYLIEIMYNYAKIEVMVDGDNINEALIYSVNILNSIEYNMSVINNLLSNDTLNYTEEEFNLFETGVDNTNILERIEEPVEETDDSDDIKDTDYIS